MARKNLYPPSVTPGIPKLGDKPQNWIETTYGKILKETMRKVDMDDETLYQLVTAKRSRGGIIPRSELYGREIKTKTQYEIRENDFLISRRQIIHGACGIVPQELDGAIVSNEYSVLRPRNGLLLQFLDYFSHTVHFQQTCFQASVGVDVEKMIFNLKEWFSFNLYIPPIEEQEKIAEILGTWDEAIGLTERLIALEEQRKKGLMQRLLTGQVRFPEFVGRPWRKVRLGDVTKFIKGYSYKSSDYAEGESPFRFITLKCVGKGGGFQFSGLKYLRNNTEERFHVSEGDLIFANTDLTRNAEVVGAPILIPVLGGVSSTISMDLTKVDVKRNIDKHFLYYLMQIRDVRNFMRARAHGSTVLHLDVKGCKKAILKIPNTIEEQRKIAAVLQTCDEKITLLQQKLAALQQQKKGLMQRLLTGRVRVAVEKSLVPVQVDFTQGLLPNPVAHWVLCLLAHIHSRGKYPNLNRIQLHKRLYFLAQNLGIPLQEEYIKYKHGPYLPKLGPTIRELKSEKQILAMKKGRGTYYSLPDSLLTKAEAYLDKRPELVQAMDFVQELVTDHEMRGEEGILASVHFLLQENPLLGKDEDKLIHAFHDWNIEKSHVEASKIKAALSRLKEFGLA